MTGQNISHPRAGGNALFLAVVNPGCETKICKQLKKRIKPQFVSPGNELPMASRAGGTVRSERGFGESQPPQRSPFHERERLGSWFGTQTLSRHRNRVLPIFSTLIYLDLP
jgi:hypothetical protein